MSDSSGPYSMPGLNPQGFVHEFTVTTSDYVLRSTAEQPPGGRFRPGLECMTVRGASSVVLRNVSTGADCSPVFNASLDGIIKIDGFGPETAGATGWPARGQSLGVSVTKGTTNVTIEGVTVLIR